MEDVTDKIIQRYKQGRREDLILLLQEIQDKAGYISEEIISRISVLLGISASKVFGVATFYDQFRFFPAGKLVIRICGGTSCFLNGSMQIVSVLKEEFGIEPGQTTKDGRISCEMVPCMGGCNNGPVIEVNGEYHINIDSLQIPVFIKKLRQRLENETRTSDGRY